MRSQELQQLVEDLKVENPHSGVATQPDSRMVILIEETDDRHELDAEASRLLLSSPESVERLFEALDYPEESFFELHNLEIDSEVMSALESFATTVDEM